MSFASGLILLAPSLAPALAQNGHPTPAKSSPDQLAFGLERLRWDMSPTEAQSEYPALSKTTSKPNTFPLTNLGTLYFDNYQYGRCTFYGVLHFEDGKLKAVEFTLVMPNGANAPCEKPMEDEFSTRYGVPVEHHLGGRYAGPRTFATFLSAQGIDFGFSDAANPVRAVTFYNVQHP